MLVGEWWHGRPMVIHMEDVVCAKDVQVTRSKNCGIADFCCALWSWWQCAEKLVQRVKKVGGLHTPALKLKNERTKFRSHALLCRHSDQVPKCTGIKKSWVRLPGFGSQARTIHEYLLHRPILSPAGVFLVWPPRRTARTPPSALLARGSGGLRSRTPRDGTHE